MTVSSTSLPITSDLGSEQWWLLMVRTPRYGPHYAGWKGYAAEEELNRDYADFLEDPDVDILIVVHGGVTKHMVVTHAKPQR